MLPPLTSYQDPGYDEIEARVASQLGIPAQALQAVRVGGERTNADRVSPAGARTVYQVIPATRHGLEQQYGVDAWSSPDNAAMAAGLLLRDNYARTNNWGDAVRMYHGGPDRSHWGPINRAYAARTAPMLASIGSPTPTAPTIPPDEEIRDSYDPRYAEAPMDQNPELAKVPDPGTAISPIADATRTAKLAAATAPQTPHRTGGILGLLGRIAMPQPDSLWAGALRSGLVNARESQQTFREQQAAQDLAREATAAQHQQAIIDMKRNMGEGTYTAVGNNVLHRLPGGGAEVIQPPPQPTENMRLIEMWKNTPPGPLRDIIERAVHGAQLDPATIAALGAQRIAAARAGAGARMSAAATTRQQRHYDPPAGYHLLPPEQH